MRILYYVHDPMCSWCWAYVPTWQKIRENLPVNLPVKNLLGGLAADKDEPMPLSMQKQIAGYWRTIQSKVPGTEFNFDFWKNCVPRRSTYPSCRAVIAARKQHLNAELKMIDTIQKAYYLQARNPSEDEVLVTLATEIGLDNKQFREDLNSEQTQQQLQQEINLATQIGARGFPSLILQNDEEFNYLPLDYNNPAPVLAMLSE